MTFESIIYIVFMFQLIKALIYFVLNLPTYNVLPVNIFRMFRADS